MMLVVSGVGGLIVGYSIGYMDGDDEERRYFAYMAIFVFAMLMLVESGNLLLLLVGWGLVGLVVPPDRVLAPPTEAVAAAKKAFVMNAVGDAAMRARLLPAHRETGSLDFSVAFGGAGPPRLDDLNLVALGLLAGAVGKSAQLPLQTWLPGRDGGPDTGVGADPRGDDGHRRGLPDRADARDLRGCALDRRHLAADLGAATLVWRPDRDRPDRTSRA